MSIQETADKLGKEFTELEIIRDKNVSDVAELLLKRDNELEPIKSVMSSHGIPYRNKNFEGTTSKGIVIGRHSNKFAVYVYTLCGSFVRLVDTENDEFADDEHLSLKLFVSQNDLSDIKAGFDYVRNLRASAAQDFADRSNEIAKFFRENSN